MTLWEFTRAHPSIIHYERTGVEGIDFAALDKKIEGSRLLKRMRSFIFFSNNYTEILAGKYDDFPAAVEEKEDGASVEEKRREGVKKKIAALNALKLSPAQLAALKAETGVYPADVKSELELAILNPGRESAAFELYGRIREYVKNDCMA